MEENLLFDSFGRRIDYLRVSLTDLCNFRCSYCAPGKDFRCAPPEGLLTCPELVRCVRIAGRAGIERVRLTGGEPLLRRDILDILRALKAIPTVRDLSITTNGSLLRPLLAPLKAAGLDRLNISLDSVEPERFRRITGQDAYREVFETVFAALEAGFPVKLNMVAMQGLSAAEIERFAGLAVQHPLEVRFLEFMPLCGDGWQADKVLPIAEVRDTVRARFDLEALPRTQVAETYRIKGGKGRVGFIAPLTESFCDTCSRMRLLPGGELQPCLFAHERVALLPLLREGAGDDAILAALREAARIKPKGNWFHERPFRAAKAQDYGDAARRAPLIRMIGG